MCLFSGSKKRQFLMFILVVFLTVLSLNFLATITTEPAPIEHFPVERARASLYQSPDVFRSEDIPLIVLPCLKGTHLTHLDWWGKVSSKGVTYYYLAGHQNHDVYPLVVSTDDSLSCNLLMYDTAGHSLPLSKFVPDDVARSLWRQRYDLFIQAQGKDTLQKLVDARNAGVNLNWSQEQKLALTDLEVQINEN